MAAAIFGLVVDASADSPQHVDGLPLSPAAQEYLKKLDRPIVLRGDYLKAVLVAWNDFSRKKLREVENGRALMGDNHSNDAIYDFISKMENYDIGVEQTSSSIVIHIGLTYRNNAPVVFGGDARYWVDRKSFTVLRKEFYK